MKKDPNKPKFIFATAFTGQVIKVPLKDYVDQGYIMQYLLNAGVAINDMQHVTFSTIPPEPVIVARSDLPTRYEVEAGLEDPFPRFPIPAGPKIWPPIWSNLMVRKYTPLIEMKNTGTQFCMIRSDGIRVNLWSYPSNEFKNPAQWKEIEGGEVGLLYGIAWRQKNMHTLGESSLYEQRLAITHGMSETTQYSISASFGASGFGLSASLSATFGQSFLIEESSTLTESIRIEGILGKTLAICVWQLVDLFYLVKRDANGVYHFIEEYEVVIEKPGKYTHAFYADPLFFGNSEKQADGNKINTNLTHPTDNVQMDVTKFDTP